MIRKIANTARDYAWGSTSLIPDYFGIPATGKPMAEIWFGTHEGSATKVVGEGISLLDLRGQKLSYLLKILAAGMPLSLQAHPSREQAIEGFARENAAGLALNDPKRNYKDDQPKPEMVVALTEFRALTGFREESRTHLLFAELAQFATGELADEIQLWRDLLGDSIEKLFSYLLSNRGSYAATVAALVECASEAASHESDFKKSFELVSELQKHFESDPGIVVSLMMNYLELQPYEALQLPAGNIHAYVSGLSVEIMAASDNVMRGGLTEKHVDLDELKKILAFEGIDIPKLEARKLANGLFQYPRLTSEYGLYRIEVSGGNLLADLDLPSGSIALCTSGEITIFDSQGETLAIKRGEAAYLADARLFSFLGNGVAFVATS